MSGLVRRLRRRVRSAPVAEPPRLELLTRTGCHLCAEMAAVLDGTLAQRGIGYTAVDVDSDPALRARWGEVVPVLLRDGVAVAKVRLERRQLERILDRRRPAGR